MAKPRGARIPARPALILLVACLVIGQAPLLLAACCAPAGATGFGSVWFVNDYAQYESALRQGAQGAGWLIHDPFTAEAHAPAFMFPLYVALGKLAALLRVEPWLIERAAEVLGRAALVLALWRFCVAFTATRGAAIAAVLLALFGGGFQLFAGLLGQGGWYTGNWSYETSTLGMLFAAPHVPLAMAGTLELARAWLLPRRDVGALDVLVAALLAAGVAMLHPFHVPVLLAAMVVVALVNLGGSGTESVGEKNSEGTLKLGRGGNLVGSLAAVLGAGPIIWYTAVTFGFDPFWSATYATQNRLPSPAPHELIVDLGPTLLLAIGGAVILRRRVAPFGLLLWLLFALIAMYLPVPFQRRLAFGLQPMLAVLAGTALVAACAALDQRRAAWLRLGVVATAASGSVLVLISIVSSSLLNTPLPVYRSTAELDAVAAWLDQRARPGEVIVADWDVMNYLAPRTAARSFGGHPVATLHAAQKQLAVASVLVHSDGSELARRLGGDWLVQGADDTRPPAGLAPAFESGPIRVYRLTPE